MSEQKLYVVIDFDDKKSQVVLRGVFSSTQDIKTMRHKGQVACIAECVVDSVREQPIFANLQPTVLEGNYRKDGFDDVDCDTCGFHGERDRDGITCNCVYLQESGPQIPACATWTPKIPSDDIS